MRDRRRYEERISGENFRVQHASKNKISCKEISYQRQAWLYDFFGIISKKNFSCFTKKPVDKLRNAIAVGTSEFMHQFFHKWWISLDGKYQNQKILSSSP
jgi:hypothetical protein